VLDRLHALYAWLHTHEGRKVFRYSMVSVISTVVSLVVIALVFGVFHVWSSEVVATVFGNAVATIPSYWLNRRWAWGKTGRSHVMKEIVPFWTMAALGIAFSIIGAGVAHHIGVKYGLSHAELTVVVLAANVISFAVFWVAKLVVFNKMFKVELSEFDEHLKAEEAVEEAVEHTATPSAVPSPSVSPTGPGSGSGGAA
jgi:putative flippase GtrA